MPLMASDDSGMAQAVLCYVERNSDKNQLSFNFF
jgi:hypothetical protein